MVLFEKSPEPGCTLRLAPFTPVNENMWKYLEWVVHRALSTPGSNVILSTKATTDEITVVYPDVPILAEGSEPVIHDIPVIGCDNVFWTGDVSAGRVQVGDRVWIGGTGMTGSETTLELAQLGTADRHGR